MNDAMERVPEGATLSDEELAKIGIGIGLNQPKDRPDWDTYFMNLTDPISSRSLDYNTNFGAVFVRDNRIICTSYNSSPPNMPDNIIPNTRDINKFKHLFVNHAEESGILWAAREGISLRGCKLYIQGHPCSSCCRKLITVGVTDWIIGDKKYQADEQELILRRFWVEYGKVRIKIQ